MEAMEGGAWMGGPQRGRGGAGGRPRTAGPGAPAGAGAGAGAGVDIDERERPASAPGGRGGGGTVGPRGGSGTGACEGGGSPLGRSPRQPSAAGVRESGAGLRRRKGITLEIPAGPRGEGGDPLDPLHPAIVGSLKRWWRWVTRGDENGSGQTRHEAVQRSWVALAWLFCDRYDAEGERAAAARALARVTAKGEVMRFPAFFDGAVETLRAQRWGRAPSAVAVARALCSGLERTRQLPAEILNVSFQDARERFALETSFVPVRRRQKRLYRLIEPRLTTAYQKTAERSLGGGGGGAGEVACMRRELGLKASPGRPVAPPPPPTRAGRRREGVLSGRAPEQQREQRR